jgi:hypothetical protein
MTPFERFELAFAFWTCVCDFLYAVGRFFQEMRRA